MDAQTNPFDTLLPEDIAELVMLAQRYAQGDEEALNEVLADAQAEASESEEEQATEEQKGTEIHQPQDLADMAAEYAEQAEECIETMTDLLDWAKNDTQDEAADPDGIEDLQAELELKIEELKAAAEEAQNAADDEDAEGAREAAALAQSLMAECCEIVKQAHALAGSDAPAFEDEEGGSEGGEGEAGEEPKGGLDAWMEG